MDLFQAFQIYKLIDIKVFGYDISFTNSSLFLIVALLLIMILFIAKNDDLIPSRLDAICEIIYQFVLSIMTSIIHVKDEKQLRSYFSFVFSIFLFIAVCNIVGLCPIFFACTSHFSVTLSLATLSFIYFTYIGIAKHGVGFCRKFAPNSAQWWILPLLIPIELISYCMRPISLAIRLCANIFAGHVLIALFGMMTEMMPMMIKGLPLLVNVAIFGLELFTALLQAYIFMTMICVYLNDTINIHH